MKTVKIILVISLIAFLNTGYAQPQERYRQQRSGQQEFRHRGPAGLNLSDEQKAKAQELRLNMQKSALPVRNKLGENQAKMRTLTTAESPDMKAINKLIDENAKLKADLEKLRAANHQEFRKMLSEEQRLELDSRPHRGHRRGFENGAGEGRGRGSGQGQGRHFKGQLE
jgi:Spy/CpxP family protein refolding chaperone